MQGSIKKKLQGIILPHNSLDFFPSTRRLTYFPLPLLTVLLSARDFSIFRSFVFHVFQIAEEKVHFISHLVPLCIARHIIVHIFEFSSSFPIMESKVPDDLRGLRLPCG